MTALRTFDPALARASETPESQDSLLRDQQRAFWTNICICNTLIVERGPDGEYVYQVTARENPPHCQGLRNLRNLFFKPLRVC